MIVSGTSDTSKLRLSQYQYYSFFDVIVICGIKDHQLQVEEDIWENLHHSISTSDITYYHGWIHTNTNLSMSFIYVRQSVMAVHAETGPLVRETYTHAGGIRRKT